MNKLTLKSLLVSFVFCSFAVVAQDSEIKLSKVYKEALFSSHANVLMALLETTELKAAMSQRNNNMDSFVEVLRKDESWPMNKSLQQEVLDNPSAKRFKKLINSSKLSFAELMLTDKVGALVAVYPKTSDYWQGDEAKYIQAAVANKNHFSEPSWDDSSSAYSFFVSIPIRKNGDVVGVLIAGLDVTSSYIEDMSLENLVNLDFSEFVQ